ncbi:MAG TPA: RagB/SusD family nutrient uptake outer membrane protein [Puia sp.]|nr:RagB/SusD family nutrient uptake outer membrane protein [Puia sp.]
MKTINLFYMRVHNSAIYFALPAVLLFTLAGCSKSFLDKKPESSLTTGNFPLSATDAESELTGAYDWMVYYTNFYQYDNFMNTDGKSDNCYVNSDNVTAEQPLEYFSTVTSSNTNVQRDWQELYNDIRAANAVLDDVPNINDPALSAARKAQILGEARFLRAYHYYWLVTEWGDCPIILSVANGGNLYPARNKKSEVYAQMILDFKYADSVLDATPYNGQLGRATKGAAEAMLAKTYAQMGDYADCLTYCNKVINSDTYSLVPNFANLWGAANKNNSESIFELQANGVAYGFFGFEIFDYVASDGYPKRDIASANLIKAFKAEGDTMARYQATINWQIPGAAFVMPANAWDPNLPIPFMNKYPDADGYNSDDDIVLIRLADIILLAAEANNQLGNTTAAVTELNQIRTRAGLPNTTASSQSDLALAILNERQLELVFECTRWNDLQRADANGTINIVNLMANQFDANGNNLNYNMAPDKHQYVFPVPLEDIQLNKNLTQNPGY